MSMMESIALMGAGVVEGGEGFWAWDHSDRFPENHYGRRGGS